MMLLLLLLGLIVLVAVNVPIALFIVAELMGWDEERRRIGSP